MTVSVAQERECLPSKHEAPRFKPHYCIKNLIFCFFKQKHVGLEEELQSTLS
jgi:hypothetical protein